MLEVARDSPRPRLPGLWCMAEGRWPLPPSLTSTLAAVRSCSRRVWCLPDDSISGEPHPWPIRSRQARNPPPQILAPERSPTGKRVVRKACGWS